MRIKNSPDLSVIQFEISLYSETPEKAPVKELIRSEIVPQIRDRLQKLGPALIAEHGKDLQHTPGSNPSSGFSTPKYMESSSINKGTTAKPTSSSAAPSSTQGYSVNVATVTDE